MGKCIYCGKPAGLFRSTHRECSEADALAAKQREEKTDKELSLIFQAALGALNDDSNYATLKRELSATERSTSLSPQQIKSSLVKALTEAIDTSLEDGLLDAKEEQRITRFMNEADLDRRDIPQPTWDRLVKSAVLEDLMNGTLPDRYSIQERLPINMLSSEKVIWAFSNSSYLEDKLVQNYVAGSQGVSIRIMQGVYYRLGAFKGRTIESTQRVHVDSGWVVLTNRHIYFAGPNRSLRIPYSNILSFIPFQDGVGIMQDAKSAKPQIFITGDGWFSYNALCNIANLESGRVKLFK